MKPSVFKKGSLRQAYAQALDAVGALFAPAKQKSAAMYARDVIELMDSMETQEWKSALAHIARNMLEDGGYDMTKDEPYRTFFGFEGGRAAFDQKYPEALAPQPSAPKGPSV